MGKKHHNSLLSPWQKLIAILNFERVTINYVFFYAILIGFVGMTLPLGGTAVYNLLSNGAIFSSTYILIGAVLLGVVVGGILLIGQLKLVESIEQRIFTRTSIEFAFRLPRIKKTELEGEHPPELVNRFFDILTIQKGLVKLLVDIVAASVTILFSAVLLAFYHPVFIGFGIVTIMAIVLVLALYYKRGLTTSIEESEYKYELVGYLEEVASNLDQYRGKEQKDSIIHNADKITSKYLHARNSHFSVLKKFFGSAVILRTVLMGALLLLGSYFVVNREMTLGQFVAAEVIIVQISYAIEKLMTGMNTIFDMVTGSEKLAVVTELELEEENH
ncbi:MAG: ABC transporter [Pseudopedobacter saltans]|uniref:ABC transporter n=1 Tax=Pseudopedobacter saltans TaxID=151895 RepID=A0A2W5F8W0_9SPHI|nr:MAG: ABC transporter [Pseudopedobacter saltans]